MAGSREMADRGKSDKGGLNDQAGVHDRRRAGSGISTAAVVRGWNVQWHTVSAAILPLQRRGAAGTREEKIKCGLDGQEQQCNDFETNDERMEVLLSETRELEGERRLRPKSSEMIVISEANLRGRFWKVGVWVGGRGNCSECGRG